MDGTVAKG